ncbi:Uncharacterised protein [BD1-7 clade bacterium]|uniref:DUF4124 domain-containing protein n=1 Tax=BD1-7 clade bacterium TaxID=2029982 RepID=A0A5S9QAC9_9GAMM|nr:Uncharacterised protein [BD1-7 clade bacterium]
MLSPLKAALFLLLTLTGIGLAWYASEQSLLLPQQARSTAQTPSTTNQFVDAKITATAHVVDASQLSTTAPSAPPSAPTKPSATNNAEHTEATPTAWCRPTSRLGKLESAKKQTVYTWVDADGRKHFSDQAPGRKNAAKGGTDTQTLELEKQQERFALTLHQHGDDMPAFFQSNLRARIHKAYDVLADFIDPEQLQKVAVNLHLFDQRSQYQTFMNKHTQGLSPASVGFHNSRDNIAAALNLSDKQLVTTSLHEAVHVMNAGMFGYLPRWLNEGIAEYLEDMEVSGQSVRVPAPHAHKMRYLQHSPIGIAQLIQSTGHDWRSQQMQAYYAHSQALVFYLQSSPEGRRWLSTYLNQQALNPCQTINIGLHVEKHYSGGVTAMQQGFTQWAQTQPPAHQY